MPTSRTRKPPARTRKVQLRWLAHARSGDKGNTANVGLIALEPVLYPILAREVTTMLHGAAELERAERATALLFGGSLKSANLDDLLMVFEDVPSTTMSRDVLLASTVSAAAHAAGLASSKGEAGRLIKQGGVYLNGERVTDDRRLLTVDDTIGGRLVVFQKGQRERRLVGIEDQ